MNITAIKTHKITTADRNLYGILDNYLPTLEEKSVLAVTSKIVAICEGRIVKAQDANKAELIQEEAEYFLPAELSKYRYTLTVKHNMLVPTAGIDESNGNGYYILWPRDPQKTANDVRQYLSTRFHLQEVGVIITDSKTTPLRWGTSGVAITHSGFAALRNYIGAPDVFGRPLKVTKANVMDALAAAAVVVMGEGQEQTPLAVISDLGFVEFQPRDPSADELQALHIDLADDLYAPLLLSAGWQRGSAK